MTHAQELTRRAKWEANFKLNPSGPGAIVESLVTGGVLAKSKIDEGDIVLKVNDLAIVTQEDWDAATYAIRANELTRITYRSGHQVEKIELNLSPLGME